MQEICRTTAPSGDHCDCRPAWQCPFYERGSHGRPCHLPGHGHRFGHGHGLGVCCQPEVTPTLETQGFTFISTVGPAVFFTAGTTSLGFTFKSTVGPALFRTAAPSPVARGPVTTTFAFSFTSTTTTAAPTTTTTPAPSLCRPLALCPRAVVDPAVFVTCQLSDGALGVLCEEDFILAAFSGAARSRAPRTLSADPLEEFVLASGAGEAPEPSAGRFGKLEVARNPLTAKPSGCPRS